MFLATFIITIPVLFLHSPDQAGVQLLFSSQGFK